MATQSKRVARRPKRTSADELKAERSRRRRAETALRKFKADALAREGVLLDAIERLPVGFAIFDARDRLVLCNGRFGEFHKEMDIGKPGLTFAEILREAMVTVIAQDTLGPDPDAWFRWRMDRHRNPGAPIEIHYRDGRWGGVVEAKTRDGGTVHVRTDITEVKAAARAAERDRALLQAIFDSVPLVISVKDRDLRYVMANRVLDRRGDPLGPAYEVKDLIGRRITELVDDDWAPPLEALDRQVIATGEPVALYELNLVRASGQHATFLSTKVPVHDAQGEMFGVLTMALDISDLRRVEAEARQIDERLADFAETSSDWFWETGPDHRFTYLSEGARMTGRDPSQFLGRARWQTPSGADAPGGEWLAHRADLDARRPFRDFTYRSLIDASPERYISVSGKPVIGGDGTFLGYRGSARDVTRRVILERELVAARDLAEGASRAKSEFLASMSHELRTPLNAIMGFSQVLMSEVFGPLGLPRYRDYARDIWQSGEHLLEVIDDVLDMAKVEAGRYELHLAEFDLGDELDRCLTMVRENASRARLSLSKDMPDLPLRLMADRRVLRQIVLNLLSNAVKFTPAGGTVSLAVSSQASPAGVAGVMVAVTDTGIGIPADQIPRLGRPFEQIANVTNRTRSGSGLGLALSRALTHQHGGRMDIESEVGRGTTVRVWLPIHAKK